MGIMNIVMIILGLSHVMACFWYGIGLQGGHAATWIDQFPEDASLSYRYSSALYWALSLFGGGMNEFVPTNTTERVYAIACFVFSFMTASMVVSSITSSMT